jgi:hypothetical protein
MPDEALVLLATDVRGKTLRILDGVDDALARFAPPGLNNTMLWHAGHALVVVEHLSVAPLTGSKPEDGYPAGWFDKFSWKSNPATVTSWPTLGEVVAKLREQQERLMAALRQASPELLARPVGDPSRGRNVRWSVIHGLHDEAGHQGEIYLLKKMAAKKVTAD